jgi:hypothetical protein
MTLCHYSDILQIAATLAGLRYDRTVGASGLGADEEADIRQSVNANLAQLWPKGRWPGVMRIERRQFRATWLVGTTYGAPTATAGVEVLDPATEEYYQSLHSANVGNAPTTGGVENSAHWAKCNAKETADLWADGTAYTVGAKVKHPSSLRIYQCITAHTSSGSFNASNFGLLTDFEPYIAFAQSGETAIDDQAECQLWTENPRTVTTATRIKTLFTQNGLTPLESCPSRPWLEYKLACPKLFGERYDSTATYVASTDQVQFATASGKVETTDFYNCIVNAAAGDTPATDTDKWTRVEIPDYFKNYLGAKGALGFLVGDDDAKYQVAESFAADAEIHLMDLLQRVQGQVPPSQIRTY